MASLPRCRRSFNLGSVVVPRPQARDADRQSNKAHPCRLSASQSQSQSPLGRLDPYLTIFEAPIIPLGFKVSHPGRTLLDSTVMLNTLQLACIASWLLCNPIGSSRLTQTYRRCSSTSMNSPPRACPRSRWHPLPCMRRWTSLHAP